MTYKKKLFPGQAIELNIPEGDFKGKYRTRVDEVGEKLLSVVAPYIQGQVIPLREGTVVEVNFWDDISAYSFDAKIMQRIAVPIPVFVLELPESTRKVQRRNFVRVPAYYPLSFRAVTREGLSDSQKGLMLDLSGGGMRFQTKEKVEKSSLLYAELELPNGKIMTPVRVCRADKAEDAKGYDVSAEFYEISERERDRIIRCVFDIQRDMRKKGLI
ncbi:MAG: flagellar brake protein [Desulfitobacteriaceae bacterium]